MSIVVLGSINADLVLSTPHLPRAGETVRATSVATHPGGKGANQAVAASRLGAAVHLVARVGDDATGASLAGALNECGVDTSGVRVDPDAPTGTALITVAADGQNTIVTSGGANHSVGAEELDQLDLVLPDASMLLIQLEIPMRIVEEAVARATAAGVAVMLDPAPVAELPASLYRNIAWITPNEHEAQALCAIAVTDDASVRTAATDLRARGVENVVVTMGERGCFYAGPQSELWIEAPTIDAVDTVACGDAFNGALAAEIASGAEVSAALRFACGAGAAAATRPGANPSLPTREQVEAVLGD